MAARIAPPAGARPAVARRVAAALWLLSVQYFAVQAIVAADWPARYSISANVISDLGNTSCGRFGGLPVCSPQHVLMNVSFVVQGLLMGGGAILFERSLPRRSRGTALGFGGLVIAGAGTILVGLYPENVDPAPHFLGAAGPFAFGNLGLVVLGLRLGLRSRLMRLYTILSGGIALVGLALFLSHHDLGLGRGGMERVVAYPQTVWMMAFAVLDLRAPVRSE